MRHTRESIEVKVDIFWHDDEGPVIDGISIDTAGIADREDVLDILDAELAYDKLQREVDAAERAAEEQKDTFLH